MSNDARNGSLRILKSPKNPATWYKTLVEISWLQAKLLYATNKAWTGLQVPCMVEGC